MRLVIAIHINYEDNKVVEKSLTSPLLGSIQEIKVFPPF